MQTKYKITPNERRIDEIRIKMFPLYLFDKLYIYFIKYNVLGCRWTEQA